MNKVLAIIGSPRKKGNTSAKSDLLDQSLDSKRFNYEKLFLSDFNIGPCTDCRACKRGGLECTVNDEMYKIYTQIENTDIIAFGTPIYWFGPSAQMKTMMDRFRPYFYNGKLKGKKACLLLPAGSGKKDCDLTISMFKRMFEALEIEYLGAVTAKAYDEGDVNENDSVIDAIKELSMVISGPI